MSITFATKPSDKAQTTSRGERKFRQNQRKLEEFLVPAREVWLKPLDYIFNQNPTDPRLDEAYVKSPWEIGFGIECGARMAQHTWQTGTNQLIGLFGAVLKHEYGEMFEMRQYQLLYIIEPEHAPVAEYLMSEIARSY